MRIGSEIAITIYISQLFGRSVRFLVAGTRNLLWASSRRKNAFFGGSDYSNESFRQKLEGVADEVIDLTLADEIENLDERFRIHELDEHPSAAANKIRADVLVTAFAKHGADLRLSIGQ